MSNTVPLGYKRVEYLESTGTQYIDTGIKPTISQKYEIKYSFTDIETNQVLFGTRTSGGYDSSKNQIYMNLNYRKRIFFVGTVLVSELSIQKDIIYTDTFYANLGNYDSTGTKNFFIFALNHIDTPLAFSTARIYSFKIYDNNVLVRDYIPVLNENNEAGLYDLVNKQFYGNSGTGSFQYGNIIPEGTIAEKFNYSLETKELIKDGINYLGGNVTDETTLKEYRDELDSVYNKLPKVSNSTASDNVILYPTLKGRIDSTLNGQIGQDTTEGYQLFNIEGYEQAGTTYVDNSTDKSITLQSKTGLSQEQTIYWTLEKELEVGKTYTIKRNIVTNSGTLSNRTGQIELYNGTTWIKVLLLANSNTNTFTVDTTGTYRIRIFIAESNNSNVFKFTLTNFIIYEGTTEKNWEEYTGRNIFPKSKL